jgi:hypothetical protein
MTITSLLMGSTATESLAVNGAGEHHTPINGGRGPLDILVMDADGERVLSAPNKASYMRLLGQVLGLDATP